VAGAIGDVERGFRGRRPHGDGRRAGRSPGRRGAEMHGRRLPGRPQFRNKEEIERAKLMGVTDLNRVYNLETWRAAT